MQDRKATGRIATAAIAIGGFAVASITAATPASAHVKWFVTCNSSDDPLPLQAAFTATFWQLGLVFMAVFYAACQIEDTRLGSRLSAVLNSCTAPVRRRADVLLRASVAVFFALVWADGSIILTPDLKDSHGWLASIQLLAAVYMCARALLPAAAAAILVLYGYGVATYGLFHMMDYLFFPGLAAYFVLSSMNPRGSLQFDCLRWSVALSLMWPSMENFLYPGWVAPIAVTHPQVTLGFDVDTFITGLGMVEFGLAFALLWTSLVRRFASAVLALSLAAMTLYLGKADGMGHLVIVMILVLVCADARRARVSCRPAVAPLVGGAALLAVVFLYTGTHVLYYGPQEAAVVPLISGTALLTVGLLCMRIAPVPALDSHGITVARRQRGQLTHQRAKVLTLDAPSRGASADMARYETFFARLKELEPLHEDGWPESSAKVRTGYAGRIGNPSDPAT